MIGAAAALGLLILFVVVMGLWMAHDEDVRAAEQRRKLEEYEARRLAGLRESDANAQRMLQDLRSGIRKREERRARESEPARVFHFHATDPGDDTFNTAAMRQVLHAADHHEPTHFPAQLAAVEAIPFQHSSPPEPAPVCSAPAETSSCGPSGYDSSSSSFDSGGSCGGSGGGGFD